MTQVYQYELFLELLLISETGHLFRERNSFEFCWWDVNLNLLEVFYHQERRVGLRTKLTQKKTNNWAEAE